MRGVVLAAAALGVLSAGPVKAGDAPDGQATIRGCIATAAKVYRLPPAVLVILLNVEGGSLGRVSPNTNGTVDIGPIQVNEIWLPDVAAHWHATIADTYRALRDNFCANVEAGAWILRRGLDEARGDFWEGVGYYHSHTPEHKTRYLRNVLRQVLRLRALVEHTDTSARQNVAQVRAPPLAP
jgi:hypothetical protein